MNSQELVKEWIEATESGKSNSGLNHWSISYVLERHLDKKFGELWDFVRLANQAELSEKVKCSLLVIDLFQEVIDWHKKRLVPLGKRLSADKRCELRQGNFFELALTGFDFPDKERKFHAVLLDFDHSPD